MKEHFDALKIAITYTPALGLPDYSRPFHLWRFSTAWYGTVRHGSVRYGTAQLKAQTYSENIASSKVYT